MHSLRFLNLVSSDADIFGSLSLSSHSKLECLDIWDPSLHLSPNGITLFASRISKLLSLSLVYLIIGPFKTLDLESLATSQSSWKDIDDALGQPKFNRLAYFVMRLSSSSEGNTDHEILQATFQYILPQSYQRGILWVGRYIGAIREYRGEHFPEQNVNYFLLSTDAPHYSRRAWVLNPFRDTAVPFSIFCGYNHGSENEVYRDISDTYGIIRQTLTAITLPRSQNDT
ncbi:hypothetical protein NLI96_g7411 [Meripilus lineatus]|uniref:Uncharacterized protein n=1 Tax=Meripilus lineatus TaxID=2056292 RepID=A0AAD5V0X7_9APHY|nr:hypothetical protein NLI96_g7411 [Physisporinus lineatus]